VHRISDVRDWRFAQLRSFRFFDFCDLDRRWRTRRLFYEGCLPGCLCFQDAGGWVVSSPLTAHFLKQLRQRIVVVLVGEFLQTVSGPRVSDFAHLDDQPVQEVFVAGQRGLLDFLD